MTDEDPSRTPGRIVRRGDQSPTIRSDRWTNPLVVTVVTAIIAVSGQWIATSVADRRAAAQLDLERLKFEYTSIEKVFAAYATGDELQAVRVLYLYNKLGFITDTGTSADIRAFVLRWAEHHGLSEDALATLTTKELTNQFPALVSPATDSTATAWSRSRSSPQER